MMDYNDYALSMREKQIAKAEAEEANFKIVTGYVVCSYPVSIKMDERIYNDDDIEELMVDEACKKFNDSIYYYYDKVEVE